MVNTLILAFPDWKKDLHVPVDAFWISLGTILAQPREGEMDILHDNLNTSKQTLQELNSIEHVAYTNLQ